MSDRPPETLYGAIERVNEAVNVFWAAVLDTRAARAVIGFLHWVDRTLRQHRLRYLPHVLLVGYIALTVSMTVADHHRVPQ